VGAVVQLGLCEGCVAEGAYGIRGGVGTARAGKGGLSPEKNKNKLKAPRSGGLFCLLFLAVEKK